MRVENLSLDQVKIRTGSSFNFSPETRSLIDKERGGLTIDYYDIEQRTEPEYFGFDIETLKAGPLAICIKALQHAGYEHLTPLLDREIETIFLTSIKGTLTQALDRFKPKPEPPDDNNDEKDQILARREELKPIQKWLRKEVKPFGFGVFLQIIPPEKLWGINAQHKQWGLRLTDSGQGIEDLQKEFPSLSLFLIGGEAREAIGTKPEIKRRPTLPWYSFRLRMLWPRLSEYDKWRDEAGLDKSLIPIPPTDIDLLAVSADRRLNLEDISAVLNKTAFKRSSGGKTIVKSSKRRPGFARVEFGTRGWDFYDEEADRHRRPAGFQMGHILPPPLAGQYDFENPLLPFLMTQSRIDPAIFLVPYTHHYQNPHTGQPEEKTLIWGIALDIFDGLKDQKQLFFWSLQSFLPEYFPFPEIMFHKDSPVDNLFRLGYMLRTLTWVNGIPVMGFPERDGLTSDQIEQGNVRRFLAKEGQNYLTEHVVYPLARKAGEEPELFGTEKQREETARSLLEDIANSLDGDLLIGLIRCLKAGVSYDRPEYDLPPWILGIGIFDEKGFFPALGQFLEEEGTEGLKRRDLLVKRMKACLHSGPSHATTTGSQEFLDFLFEETGFYVDKTTSAEKVAQLLTPVFYPQQNWKRFLKQHLVDIDERFAVVSQKPSYRQIVLGRVLDSDAPLTAEEIARQVDISVETTRRHLNSLVEKGFLGILGGRRKEYGDRRPTVPGTGGSRIFYVSPPLMLTIVENPVGYIRYLRPERRIRVALTTADGKTMSELQRETGLNYTTLQAVIERLMTEGIIHCILDEDDESYRKCYYLREGE